MRDCLKPLLGTSIYMNKKIICHDRLNKEHIARIEDLKFRPSVYAVIIRQGKILLSPQWDGYDFPGGGINKGETIDKALKREVWEETGYKVRVKNIIDCFDSFFYVRGKKKYWHCLLLYYTCVITGGSISDAHFDEDEKQYMKKAQWIKLDKINQLRFYNNVDSVSLIKQIAKQNT